MMVSLPQHTLLLALLLPSLAQAAPPPVTSVAQYWQSQIAPARLQRLSSSGAELAAAAQALCDKPDGSKLERVRSAWTQTMLAWRAAETLPLEGQAAERIAAGPAEMQTMEAAVRMSTEQQPIAAETAASARGLAALEYLYWGNERPQAQLGRLVFAQRCGYAQAVAAQLANDLTALQLDPQPVERYRLRWSALLRQLRESRLNAAANASLAPSQDAWRSGQTRAASLASLDGLQALLLQPSSAGGWRPLDQLLSGDAQLAQRLPEALERARGELSRLPSKLTASGTRPENLLPAQQALAAVQQLLDGPLGLALSPAAGGSSAVAR